MLKTNILVAVLWISCVPLEVSATELTNNTCVESTQANICFCSSNCGKLNICCEEVYDQYAPGLKVIRSLCLSHFNGLSIMVKDCSPSLKNSVYAPKCLHPVGYWINPRSGVPVIDNSSGILYRNQYCAFCNGLRRNQFKFPKTKLKCPKTSFVTPQDVRENAAALLKNKTCELRLSGDNRKESYGTCKNDIISDCPLQNNSNMPFNSTLIDLCRYGPMKLSLGNTFFFRNQYCCDCHNTSCKLQSSKLYDSPLMSELVFPFDIDAMSPETEFPISYNDTNNGTVIEATFWTIPFMIAYSVSTVSLITLLVVFIVFPSLRNIPGLLTMNLACCLLLLALANLISFDCKTSSIFRHWSYLSSYGCMCLFGIDLMKTLRSSNVSRHGHENGTERKDELWKYLKFSIVGFGPPTLIVFVSFMVNLLAPTSVISPRYAQPKCWFNSVWGGVVWFVIPAGCTIVFNTVVCGMVFYYIFVTARQSRSAHDRKVKDLLVICLKLTLLLGLGWILEFVLTNITVLKVASRAVNLFNALQGFLLALMIIFSTKVRKELRESRTTVSSMISNRKSRSLSQNMSAMSKEGGAVSPMEAKPFIFNDASVPDGSEKPC